MTPDQARAILTPGRCPRAVMGEQPTLDVGRHVGYYPPDMRRHGIRCGRVETRVLGDLADGRIAIRYCDHSLRFAGQRELVPATACRVYPLVAEILAGHERDLELQRRAADVLAADATST